MTEQPGSDFPAEPQQGFGGAAGEMGEATEVEAPLSDPIADDPMVSLARELEERTSDLQRLQAEFLNYKRRVERDRELVVENAKFTALAPVLEVIDTIDRAREHGELDPGFKAAADQLESVLAAQGLIKFGVAGDAFDPTLHDALSHLGTDPEVQQQTVKVVAKCGYKLGDRVVRAAQVLVVDPQ